MPVFEIDDNGLKFQLDAKDYNSALLGYQAYRQNSVAKQIASGSVPVKSSLQRTIENIPESAENLAKGVANTAVGAGEALMSPNPMDKLRFIKNQAVGIVDTLKNRYGSGLAEAVEKDPVGVFADVLSLASGVRGGLARGKASPVEAGAGIPSAAETSAATDFQKLVPGQPQTAINQDVSAPMDVGGEAVIGQVERLGQTSVAGRQIMEPFLTARQEGSLARISTDLKELTGTTRSALQAQKQVMAERQAASDPAYKAAYNAGDRAIDTQELGRLSNVPEVQSAMRTAVRGWQRSQVAQGYGALEPGHIVERGGILKFLNGKVPVFPNLQFWDYTKSAIDKMIDNETRPDGSMTRKGRDLTIINKSLVQQLDQQVPEYSAARQAWGGPSQYIKALETGADILKRGESAEEMEADFNSLSDVNKQAYRESAVSAILNKLQSNPSAEGLADLTRDLKSPAMRRKIAALMPNQAAKAAWNQRLNFEVNSSQLVAAGLKGSQTARRLAQAQSEEAAIDDVVFQTLRAVKSPKTEFVKYIADGWAKIKEKLKGERDAELAKLLTGQKKPVSLRTVAKETKSMPSNIPTSLLPATGSALVAPNQNQQ